MPVLGGTAKIRNLWFFLQLKQLLELERLVLYGAVELQSLPASSCNQKSGTDFTELVQESQHVFGDLLHQISDLDDADLHNKLNNPRWSLQPESSVMHLLKTGSVSASLKAFLSELHQVLQSQILFTLIKYRSANKSLEEQKSRAETGRTVRAEMPIPVPRGKYLIDKRTSGRGVEPRFHA